MQVGPYYRINTPTVVHETMGNEVIIIDLDSGNYFSLEDVAAAIWRALATTGSVAAISEAVRSEYDCNGRDVEALAASFLQELEENDLITPASGPPAADRAASTGHQDQPQRPPFSPPVLTRYTDMQDLLLLDPIHDVDETGWPNLPADAD